LESVVVFTAIVSTSPTINKADLDVTFLDIANQIKALYLLDRVVLINYPITLQAVL